MKDIALLNKTEYNSKDPDQDRERVALEQSVDLTKGLFIA